LLIGLHPWLVAVVRLCWVCLFLALFQVLGVRFFGVCA
ncbi:MAG: hypothetical protein ACI9EQ_002494, partial [Bacteroidia bacterium]